MNLGEIVECCSKFWISFDEVIEIWNAFSVNRAILSMTLNLYGWNVTGYHGCEKLHDVGTM